MEGWGAGEERAEIRASEQSHTEVRANVQVY